MYSIFILVLNLFLVSADSGTDNSDDSLHVNNIASALVTLLGADEKSVRIKDLKEKLKKVDGYVIDKDKYAQFLLNETMTTDLDHTSFYNALKESDHFRFLLETEPKNLYLKLKEKMTRDDILKILSERETSGKLSKSARRVMNNIIDDDTDDGVIDDVVDKMIAQSPSDDHKFDYRKEDNKYWDPQQELEDLKEYHRHDGRRIFKGERTTIKYYPFMVSVHVMGRFWCGGVIYWHDLVLTSAACLQLMHNNRFYRENPAILKVRVGSNHSRIGGEMVEALEVYFHPGYNPRTLRHNIAVIRLQRRLFFNYHRVPKMISISYSEGGVSPTSEVLVLGWGVNKMSQTLAYEPVFLNRKFLPIYPNVFCKEVYGEKFISSTMFCAGTFTTGEGACDHDAGGPAVLAGRLVGIISFGPAVCGYPNSPTVFTLVGAYADWIESINEQMPSYYRGKKRSTTLIPYTHLPELLPTARPAVTATATTTAQTTVTDTTTRPTLRKRNRKRVKLAEDTDTDGFSIDLK